MCGHAVFPIYPSMPNLTDESLSSLEEEWYMNGGCYILQGEIEDDYGIMSLRKVNEVTDICPKSKRKIIDIYTDS